MVMQYLMYAVIAWFALGWLVVGLITLRDPKYFARMGLATYLIGGMITATVWPNCVSMVWARKRRPSARRVTR